VCDACRFSEHDRCQGYLATGRRLRCLCRECLDVRLTAISAAVRTERASGDRSERRRPVAPARPILRLLRGGAAE
jgi:hypothetical protein